MKNSTLKSIVSLTLVLMLLSSCYTAKHHYQAGNYEKAVAAAAKKLRKNPNKTKQIRIIEKAYKAVVEKELSKIEYLKLEGSPDNWVEIHKRYECLDYVVGLVKPLIPLYLKKELRYIDIELIDVKHEMAQAKLKAADYLYTDAERLLKSEDKMSIRYAYYKLLEVKELYPSYKNVNTKIDEAYARGQEYVLITVVNESQQLIPKTAFEQVSKMAISKYNSTWVKYRSEDDGSAFSKKIAVVIENIGIGPEQVFEKNYHYEKEIEDGWKYQLDGNGNVMKDTSGNDIKIPVIRRIAADVLETRLAKEGGINGSFRIYDLENKQMIQNQSFTEAFGFNHMFMTLRGDKRAVPKDIISKLGGRPAPFPSDELLLIDAFSVLKTKLSYFIDREINSRAEYVATK